MDHPAVRRSSDQWTDPSSASYPSKAGSQAHEGAEATAPPTKNMYMPIGDVQLEELEMYREDGFHPVHLGDKLYNDDFEVVAKLGDGGFGTVWLCLEGPELTGHLNWRAVKVLAASVSDDMNPELRIIDDLRNEGITRQQWEEAGILLAIRHFFIDGPNGRHLCLVFPVMGPSLVSQMYASADAVKDVLTQAGKSLEFLHANGICHGDFTSDNVLLHIDDVGRISKNEMRTLLEGPIHEVRMADGSKPLKPNAPRYLVERGDIGNLTPKTQTATIDFGISYNTGDPPAFVGIPRQYAAPEAFFAIGNTGETSDVWSYICMIQEIRCRGVFFDTSKRSGYVKDLQVLLGPLPDSYRLSWKEELEYEGVVDDDDSNNAVEESTKASQFVSTTAEEVKRQRQVAAETSGYADYLQGLIGANRETVVYQRDANYTPSPTKVSWRVPEEEVFQLADLFQKVLKYDPDERIRIGEVLQHEWFQVGEAGDGKQPTEAYPTARTSHDGTKGETSDPNPEDKRVSTTKAADTLKTPGTADKGSSVGAPESTTTNNGRTAASTESRKDDTAPKPSSKLSPSAPSKEKKEPTPSSASQSKDQKPSTAPKAAPPRLEPITQRVNPNPKDHHNPSVGHQAFDICLHLLSIFFLISALAFFVILLLPMPLLPPSSTTLPPTTIIRGGHPLRFPNIVTIRQAWCGAGAPGCGSGIDAAGAVAPIPWFKTRGVSPHSVFYEGILTMPSNETVASPDGEGDRRVESGSGGEKKRFEGLLVIPGI